MAGLYLLEKMAASSVLTADNSVQWIVTLQSAAVSIYRDAHEEIQRSIACSHRGGLPAADLCLSNHLDVPSPNQALKKPQLASGLLFHFTSSVQ